MAYLGDDNKQKKNPNDPQASGGGSDEGGGEGSGAVGGGAQPGGASSAPQPQQQQGTGGNSGWTNMQAYLNANQNSQGSANALSNQATGTFNKEQGNFNNAKNSTLGQAGTNVMGNYVGSNQVGGLSADDYQKHMNATYGGPAAGSFAYGMGTEAQDLGKSLGSDATFNQHMQQMYNQAAGGQMNSGASMLQSQFDNNNQALQGARQNALTKWAGLQDSEKTGIDKTNQGLKSWQDQFTQNQGDLKTAWNTDQANKQAAQEKAATDAETQKENQLYARGWRGSF